MVLFFQQPDAEYQWVKCASRALMHVCMLALVCIVVPVVSDSNLYAQETDTAEEEKETENPETPANLGAGIFAAYQFLNVEVSANVVGEHAEVSGDFTFELPAESLFADVSLSFGTCQLKEPIPTLKSEDGSRFRSQFLAESSGYRVIVDTSLEERGNESKRYAISLDGVTTIRQEGSRRILRINLPFQSGVLRVKLPRNSTDIRVAGDEVLEQATEEDHVAVNARTRGGEFELSWREQENVGRAAAIDAQSEVLFRITTPEQRWDATATLKLNWYGSDVANSVRIRLPEGARWNQQPKGDFETFSVRPILAANANFDVSRADLEIINLDPVKFPILELRDLAWEWTPEMKSENDRTRAAKIAVPEILGASSHRGTIDVMCPALFLLIYKTGDGVSLVQQSLVTDTYTNQQLQFGFFKQPFDLNLKFEEEVALPTIRPTYHVAVDENKLVMTAWLDCSFDVNTRSRALTIMFGDWIPEDNTARALKPGTDLLGSGEVLRVEQPVGNGYRISSPDYDSAGFDGRRKVNEIWRIVAQREWFPEENDLRFNIPEIVRGQGAEAGSGSGILVLTSQDRIVLDWDETLSRELLPDSLSSEYLDFLPTKGVREPQVYRFQSGGGVPNWAGGVTLLPQEIVSNELVTLDLSENELTVKQSSTLDIANVPLENLQVAVPETLEQESLEFRVNGSLVTGEQVRQINSQELKRLLGRTAPSEKDESTGWYQYSLLGVQSLTDQAEVSVSARMKFPDAQEVSDVRTLSLTICELVLPTIPRVANRRVLVDVTSEQVSLMNTERDSSTAGIWRIVPSEGGLRVSALQSELKLRLQNNATDGASEAEILKSWLQTAITFSERQDRFVAKIRTDAESLRLKLPERASIKPAPRIFIDGKLQRQAYDALEEWFELTIESTTDGEHQLEVIYEVTEELEDWSRVRVEAPQILGAESSGRFYWQFATPRTNHLAWAPESLAADWRWKWGGVWWFRSNSLSEAALVAMMESTEPRLPAATNRYLMSGSFPDEPFDVVVFARYVFWFPIGCISIGIAACVLNFEFMRRPIAGILLAVPLFCVAIMFPDLGALLGQTVAISLALVFLVWVTHSAIDSRVRRRSVFTARPSLENSGQISARSSRIAETESARGSSIAAGSE